MRWVIGLLLSVLLLSPAAAFAQEALAPTATPTAAATDDTTIQKTWGQKRVIRTLQRRLFAKFGRMEFTAFAGIVPNDPFVFYTPIGLRFDYHFNEAFALEVAGSFLGCFTGDVGNKQERGFSQGCLRFASDLKSDLADPPKVEQTQIRSIKLIDQQVTRLDMTAMWSPIFGKVAAMNDTLVHFDVNLVGGAGFLLTEKVDDVDLKKVDYNPTFEAVLGAGVKFYFGERYGIRADFRQFIHPKQAGGTANPSEISLGFSVFTD
ncbi:MAG: hypothetical protein CO108_28710 [Deltaproteobacteria bacterium CG_4_9_14_3_um_filter_63_12]|nr:MAG: hypothetical protein COW42_15535 [Deltaproteobacteria bacterium CG17_big_fil_post_rev_8_21_14_2_50_63_7]PJB34280.1 MAG: hypothetical protein CO108_28710 [Deltaproteobacteria bacterium CG_4_9_14_3_um_filter_63_12]